MSKEKRIKIKSHLVNFFPLLSTYIEKVTLQGQLKQNKIDIADAVIKVVTG